MSKKNDQKRKVALSVKSQAESFRFDVEWRRKKLDTVPTDHPVLKAELDVIIELGLVDAFMTLRDIVNGVREELGAIPETDRGTLNGAVLPFILGITPVNPMTADTEKLWLSSINATDMLTRIMWAFSCMFHLMYLNTSAKEVRR